MTWWNQLNSFGLKIGYFPIAKNSWLILKPEKYEIGKAIFKDTKLNITSKGTDTLEQWLI